MRDWDAVANAAASLRDRLRASRAINVNKADIRIAARNLVQTYFRETRNAIKAVDEATLDELDGLMQRLLKLSNGNAPKTTYQQILKSILAFGPSIQFALEKQMSEGAAVTAQAGMSSVETAIMRTLSRALPDAAASYAQAIDDMTAPRVSYRGTAVELREALREVLDHYAPDSEVVGQAGFKLESGRSGPTMAQKVKYISKKRRRSEASTKPSIDAAAYVENVTGRFVRDTYTSGSVAVHVACSKADVQQLKLHVDAALAEILGVFHL